MFTGVVWRREGVINAGVRSGDWQVAMGCVIDAPDAEKEATAVALATKLRRSRPVDAARMLVRVWAPAVVLVSVPC